MCSSKQGRELIGNKVANTELITSYERNTKNLVDCWLGGQGFDVLSSWDNSSRLVDDLTSILLSNCFLYTQILSICGRSIGDLFYPYNSPNTNFSSYPIL
jgi:hypothetical protein